MPLATSLPEFYDAKAFGPALQYPMTAAQLGLPTSVPASGSVQSNIIQSDGFKVLAVGLTSSQAGSLNVQYFLDAAGTVKQGASANAALTAATPGVNNLAAPGPFQSFQITVTNTGASTATLTNILALLQAN